MLEGPYLQIIYLKKLESLRKSECSAGVEVMIDMTPMDQLYNCMGEVRLTCNQTRNHLSRSTALVNFIPGICAVILPITENVWQRQHGSKDVSKILKIHISTASCTLSLYRLQKQFKCISKPSTFLITYAYALLITTTLYFTSLAAS